MIIWVKTRSPQTDWVESSSDQAERSAEVSFSYWQAFTPSLHSIRECQRNMPLHLFLVIRAGRLTTIQHGLTLLNPAELAMQ